MEKEALEIMLKHPELESIRQKLEKIGCASNFEFTSRDSRDPKHGIIPTIRFKLKSEGKDQQATEFYVMCNRYLRKHCEVPNLDNNLTVVYANLNSEDNPENYRNIDIYLKNMTPAQQVETFDKLAITFSHLLDTLVSQ